MKSVFATVQSRDVIEARIRTGGTIEQLGIDEGDFVRAGQVLAVVSDPKLALKISALDAQIEALRARLAEAETELHRAENLRERGTIPQARLDEARTARDVADNDLQAARAERSVLVRQQEEGKVLAPASGRILQVPVTQGSVVLPGESIATIAANSYLLRLELPERHARFIAEGDSVQVGPRGLEAEPGGWREGRIVQVYPELRDGHVVADAETSGLGDYFVGERALVRIVAGTRAAIMVPESMVFQRFGVDYVRIEGEDGAPLDVVVQRGRSTVRQGGRAMVEILSGLQPGDRVLAP